MDWLTLVRTVLLPLLIKLLQGLASLPPEQFRAVAQSMAAPDDAEFTAHAPGEFDEQQQ